MKTRLWGESLLKRLGQWLVSKLVDASVHEIEARVRDK